MARRFADACLLRASAFRDTPAAMTHALMIVAAVAVAHALGAIVRGVAFDWSPVTGATLALVNEVGFWAAGGATIGLVGRVLFRSRHGPVGMLRAFGIAAAPGVLVFGAALASVVSAGVEQVILPSLGIWRVAAAWVGTRETLELGVAQSAVALICGILAGFAAVFTLGTAIVTLMTD